MRIRLMPRKPKKKTDPNWGGPRPGSGRRPGPADKVRANKVTLTYDEQLKEELAPHRVEGETGRDFLEVLVRVALAVELERPGTIAAMRETLRQEVPEDE